MEKRIVKILAIDDNFDNLIVLNALIEETFPEAAVLTALNGNAGFEIALKEDPDVILLDILMPGIDGFKVCQKLKADNVLRDIPVVFITALKGDRENRVKALEAGAEAFISKPIDEIELIAEIRAMVKIKEANIRKRNEQKRLSELVEWKTRELKETHEITLKLLDDLRGENEARKVSEKELRESQNRLQSVTESASDAIISINSEGTIFGWNRGAERMFGYKKLEIVGRNVKILMPESYQESHVIGMNRVLATGEHRLIGKTIDSFYAVDKNGREFPIELSLAEWDSVQEKFFTGIVRDITERKKSEEKILQSLKEKETLIQELYHRTKNTMQVIRGMLVLQSMDYPSNSELQSVIENTEQRIQAISLVHDMLYKRQDLSYISIKDYLHELTNLIVLGFESTEDRIKLNLKVEDLHFLLDTAIPLGLILNELITNSLKHAFPGNRTGNITISLIKKESDKNLLVYSDDGIGVSEDFDFKNQNTLGFKLIYGIGEEQMLGKVSIVNKDGINCSILFPDNIYKPRV